MTCTFFGHKDTPFDIKDKLKNTLVSLIEKQGAKVFYVGNQGNFDIIVRHILEELKNEYSHIDYTVVLAYMPTVKKIMIFWIIIKPFIPIYFITRPENLP
ncbi:MAG: DUF1273 family protein [Clostridia bacterium]|nr:DUF1273 family protein [Clostridia bacterium]